MKPYLILWLWHRGKLQIVSIGMGGELKGDIHMNPGINAWFDEWCCILEQCRAIGYGYAETPAQ